MEIFRFIIFVNFLTEFSNGKSLTKDSMNSLRCTFLDSEGPCVVFGGEPIPQRLKEIFENQSEKVQDAIKHMHLGELSEEDLYSIPPPLLLLIPTHKLSSLGSVNLSYLLSYWSHNMAIIKHLSKAFSHLQNKFEFLIRLHSLPVTTINVLAEEIVSSNESWIKISGNLQQLASLDIPLLPHFPSTYLLKTENIGSNNKLLFYLRHWILQSSYDWSYVNDNTKRIWAFLMVQSKYPQTLNLWKENTLGKMGYLLIGCTADELNQINSSLIDTKKLLGEYNFNTLQIRTLFNKFYKGGDLNDEAFEYLKKIVIKLTPEGLQHFVNSATNYTYLNILPEQKSLATSLQIIEYLILENKKSPSLNLSVNNLSEDDIEQIGQLVYALPLSSLTSFRNNPLPLPKLITLQSPYLSKIHAYFLTGNGTKIRLDEFDFKCNALLHAISSSTISTNISVSSDVYSHLFSNMPGTNTMRSLALLNKFWDRLGNKEVWMWLLDNPDRNNYLSLLPSKNVREQGLKVIPILSSLQEKYHGIIPQLPVNILAGLLHLRNNVWTWDSLINSKIPYKLLLNGLSCQDIRLMETADFIAIMGEYTRLRYILRQRFPKNLQHCCAEKLKDYLKMKSILTQQYNPETLTNLLTESDMLAVGGYVLSHMSISDIEKSNHINYLIQLIGRLSLPELLLAAPKSKLQDIILLLTKGLTALDSENLFRLGNLTLFLPEYLIHTIEPSAFRLILESQYIDKRLCCTNTQMTKWKDLIISTFGDPSYWSANTLEILGDMLLAVPNTLLLQIPKSSWIEAVDILSPSYNEVIDWWQPEPFYKVCLSQLDKLEKENYLNNLQNITRWHLFAAQLQLNTVVPAYQLKRVSGISFGSHTAVKTLDNKNILIRVETPPVTLISQNSSNKIVTVPKKKFNEEKSNDTHTQDKMKDETIPDIFHSTVATDLMTTSTTFKETYSDSEYEVSTSFTSTNPLDDSFLYTFAESQQTDSLNNDIFFTTKLNSEAQVEVTTKHFITSQDLSIFDKENNTSEESLNVEPFVEPLKNSKYIQIQTPELKIITEESINKTFTNVIESSLLTSFKPTNFLTSVASNYQDNSTKLYLVDSTTIHTETSKLENIIENFQNTDFYLPVEPLSAEVEESIKVQIPSFNILTNDNDSDHLKNNHYNPFTFVGNESFTYPDSITLDDFELTSQHTPYPINYVLHDIDTTVESKYADEEDYNDLSVSKAPVSKEFSHELEDSAAERGKKLFTTISKVTENTVISLDDKESILPDSTEFTMVTFADPPKAIMLAKSSASANPALLTSEVKKETYDESMHTITLANNSKDNISPFVNFYDAPSLIKSDLISEPSGYNNDYLETFNSVNDPDNNIAKFVTRGTQPSVKINSNIFKNNSLDIMSDNSFEYLDPLLLTEDNEDDDHLLKRSVDSLSFEITCTSLRMVGQIAELALTLNDIKKMSDNEINNCIEIFSEMNLPLEIKKEIWKRLDKDLVHFSGNLIEAADYTEVLELNLNYSNPWSIETVSLIAQFNKNNKTKALIVDKLLKGIQGTAPLEAIIAVGPLMGYIDGNRLKNIISPNILVKASAILGKYLPCHHLTLSKLIKIAIQPKAFGNPKYWTVEDIETLGVIFAGLSFDQWKYILYNNSVLLSGIHSSAMLCLPEIYIREIPNSLISSLPALSILAMEENGRKEAFTPKQREILELQLSFQINHESSIEETSANVTKISNSISLIFFVYFLHLYYYL